MMKKNLLAIVAILSLAGCAPTVYHKKVTIHMNAQGVVQSIDVVEEMTQSLDSVVRTDMDPVYKYLGK